MGRPLTLGVLALQGAFAKHCEKLKMIGVETYEVRKPHELQFCDGLIIPGGESTTISKQMAFIGMEGPLLQFASTKPCFGTCAGLILMSSEVEGKEVSPLGLIDISVTRNAYGRQSDSFTTHVNLQIGSNSLIACEATFIRAPMISRCGNEVSILAKHEGRPVLVQQGRHLAATFHPELTEDLSVHRHFCSLCKPCSTLYGF